MAPNHSSYLDPPILGISLKRRVTYLAKEYLFKAFFVGWVLRSIAALPIKSETDDFRSIRALIRLLKEGRCIVVFPEGTRSPDGRLRAPESGVGFLAAKSDAYVVPIYIDGSYEAFPKGVRIFRPHKIRVRFGKAFVPSAEKELMSAEDPYGAVSTRIMDEIKKLREEVIARSPLTLRGINSATKQS